MLATIKLELLLGRQVRHERSRDAGRRKPGERLAVELGVGNIKATIDYHLVTQPATGIHPGDSRRGRPRCREPTFQRHPNWVESTTSGSG